MEDLYNLGERMLKTAASTTSNIAYTTSAIVSTSGVRALGYIGSSSIRPEVPTRAVVAAAVARQIAALPPHERLSLSSSSLGTPSIYGVRPSGKAAEELGEDFYEEGFDPVRHMLEHLPVESNDLNQQYFDTKGGEKLLQLDMITERLSKQVMENHEEMVKGMQLVTELDRDLQLTSIICKNGRRFLSIAAQEVTQDLLIAENVKKKQVLLGLLPILERIQLAIETKSRLNSTVEEGDYALALQLCSESALLLEECSDLTAVIDMNHSLEDWLQRTIASVDKILLTVCHKFNPDKYSSVLFAYAVLEDISGLAEKAQTFYAQIIVSETHAVVRNVLFEGQDPQILLNKTRTPYNELCAQLSEANFKECLRRSLEVLFDVLSSYYKMMTWKPLPRITTISNQVIEKVGLSNGKVPPAGEVRSAREDLPDGSSVQVGDAMLSVSRALERGRKTVWELCARRVAVLLSCEALCTTSPHQFLHSLDWVTQFILGGEAFCGVEAMTLRAKLVKQSEKYYWTFHRQNLEVLRVILGKELWQPLCSPILKTLYLSGLLHGTPILRPSDGLEGSTGGSSKPKEVEDLQLTKRENPSSRANFDDWLRKGNPFLDRRVVNLVSNIGHENGKVMSGMGSYEDGLPQEVRTGDERTGDEEGEDQDLLADFIDEDSQLPGRLDIEYMQNSGKVAHANGASLILTTSAVNLLRYMEKYIKLMQILQPIVSEVFRGLCQLFELYFFTVFKVFGNRDFLAAPLRSALVRISQGLEEQRVQLRSSPKRTSSTGPPTASGNSSLPLEPSLASGGTMPTMVPNNLYALKERTVAVESLLCLSQILQKSHSDLKTMLPQDTLAYMEQFLNETAGLVPDLRVHTYKVAARLVLNIGGYIDRIANARWELRELGVEHNGYVDLLLGEFKQYTNKLSLASVSMEVQEAMLEYGVDVVAETVLEGLSRVKKCNNEGRALMSLDVQVLINGLRHLAPQKLKSNLLVVETYVKAFYLPETEYLHWIRAHPEYSKAQVIGLINLVASTYNWRRKTKMDLLEKIESGDT